MRKQMKIYRLVDKIMRFSNGTIPYEQAYKMSEAYYKSQPSFFSLSNHVDTNYIARECVKKLMVT